MQKSDTERRARKICLESELYGRWRRYYRAKPSLRRWTKRYTHKRERREGRNRLRDET